MASPLLSPPGLFAPEPDYFRSETPRPATRLTRNSAASPDLNSLPRHTFPSQVEDSRLANLSGVTRASLLEVRPAAATVATGIAELDALTSGIPRGALTEIYGPASSGRTSVQLALLAEMTRRQEVCAIVDVSDSFDPHSAAAAGVDLQRVLWIRCGVDSTGYRVPTREPNSPRRHGGTEASTHYPAPRTEKKTFVIPSETEPSFRGDGESRDLALHSTHRSVSPCLRGELGSQLGTRNVLFRALEQALKVTDLLLQSSGFGLIAVDLGDIPPQIARRVPLTSWFRFRRAVENTPTILLVMEQEPYARTCASLVLKMYPQAAAPRDQAPTAELPMHARLLRGLGVTAEVVRTRAERKPPRSVAAFEMQTMWVRSRIGPSGDRVIG